MKRLASLCLILAAFAAASQNLPNRRTAGAVTLTNNNYYLDGGEIHQGDDAGLKNLVVTGTCTGCGGCGGSSISDGGTPLTGTGITINQNSNTGQSFIDEVTVDYLALDGGSAAATTINLDLWSYPIQTRIDRVIAKLNTQFSGGDGGTNNATWTAATVTCSCPTGGIATNGYLLSSNLKGTVGTIYGDADSEEGANITGNLSGFFCDYPGGFDTKVQVRCTFSVTPAAGCMMPPCADIRTGSAGSATFWIQGQVFP